MLPGERELVARLKDKPFALLGINSDQSRSALKKAIDEAGINWANIYDGPSGKGAIARRWNVFAWPTIFVVDQKGVIRARGLHDDSFIKVVDELIEQGPHP